MSRVRFGDVVRDVKLKVDRDNNPYEYYLAGEHFDSERLFIPRRGLFEGSDVGPAFIRIFKPGQVLYGSRRTYLKKVAVADFEGITANTTFVLETKDEDVLAQRLLPFIMLSDDFTKWSIEHSKGSTNPYVLYSDLAEYEFDLPPIEIQRKLSDLLCEGESLKEVYRRLLIACEEVVKSRFVEMFGDGSWPESHIGDLASDIRYGTSKKAADEGEYTYLRMNNMTDDGRLDLTDTKRITLSGDELESCLVRHGDVLFNRTNSREKVGKTAVFDLDVPMVIAGYIIRVRLKPVMRSQYLSVFMNLASTKKLLRDMAKGAVHQANISAKEMASIEVPVPPIELQDEFLSFVSQVDKSEYNGC